MIQMQRINQETIFFYVTPVSLVITEDTVAICPVKWITLPSNPADMKH